MTKWTINGAFVGYTVECLEHCGTKIIFDKLDLLFLCDECTNKKIPFYNQLEEGLDA